MKTKNLIRQHKEKMNTYAISLLAIIFFFLGFAQAILIYTISSYFKTSFGTENVGIFYFIPYAATLYIFLNIYKILHYWKQSFFLFLLLFLKILIIFGLLFLPASWAGSLLLMLYIIIGALIWSGFNVILESFSEDNFSGRIRGIILAIVNTGFLVGPFLAFNVLEKFGFSGVFLIVLPIYSLILILSIIGFRHIDIKSEKITSIKELIGKFWQRKNISKNYYIAFVLDFFYSIMIIFAPIYLLDLGFSWEELGKIFTLMLIPFVIIQYPIGFIADKKIGEKELLIVAIFLMGFSTLFFYLNSSRADLASWAIILILTRIGAAMMEVLRDSYFYKRIDGRDANLIHFFHTYGPLAQIAAVTISFPIILFFPLKTIFLITAIVIFSALIPAFLLVDNKSEREIFKKNY